jgi:hypothetical protein
MALDSFTGSRWRLRVIFEEGNERALDQAKAVVIGGT